MVRPGFVFTVLGVEERHFRYEDEPTHFVIAVIDDPDSVKIEEISGGRWVSHNRVGVGTADERELRPNVLNEVSYTKTTNMVIFRSWMLISGLKNPTRLFL